MAFLGLRKWPTPARPTHCNNLSALTSRSLVGPEAHVAFHCCFRNHLLPRLEGSGHGCPLCVHFACAGAVHANQAVAEGFKNDPRNPYREEIAKEEAAAHH